jgi:exodeoxyribonuclease VII small subunit
MGSKNQKEEPPSFEQAMAELEQIVGELEGSELTLEQSLERYERGVKAVKRCREVLDKAEKRLQILLSDEEGNLTEKPFEEEAQ